MASRTIVALLGLFLFCIGLPACMATSDDTSTGPASGTADKADGVGQFCGGFAGIQCPEGLRCVYARTHPDASGRCALIEDDPEPEPEPEVPDAGGPCWDGEGTLCTEGEICILEDPTVDASGYCAPEDAEVEGAFCGGIAGILCPDGQRCELDGSYPDAGGHCIRHCQEIECEFECDFGFEMDSMGCAICSCLPEDCPDPEDPNVTFISHEPATCAALRFACEEGASLFSDDCGCGCIAP